MKGKRVLVTGAGGFIGSHLCEALVTKGCEVKSFVRYNSRNSWGWLEHSPCKGQLEVITGDIRDFDSVKDVMRNVDIVFHLAALIGIPYSYVSSLAYVKTNVEGTYNILRSAKELGTEKVVITSTSEVYGTAQFTPITEEHPINPQSPYSATKASADFLAMSFYRSFDLPVSVVRPFNTYGPRQSARAIIPNIIAQALAREEIFLGSLFPTRDFSYVDDTVKGFVQAASSNKSVGEVINIGSGSEVSIEQLAGEIISLVKKQVKISLDNERVRPLKSEVKQLVADNTKAKRLIGWEPTVSLKDGLKNTIEWVRENREQFKDDIYNI
jgi:NAD dependent epimerase/dehydratase